MNSEQFWICKDWLKDGGEKVLGPFESQDLALIVRGYVEKVEGHQAYFVDCESARVAVVRPTDDELATTVRAMIEDGHPCGSRAADEWFGIVSRRLDEPASAVVRPTRDEIADVIAETLAMVEGHPGDDGQFADDVADAVLALFGVAVSDSQETPE